MDALVISKFQADVLLHAKMAGKAHVSVSPDLGLSMATAALNVNGAVFPSGEMLSWQRLEEIADAPRKCFAIRAGDTREIRQFSETTGWVRSLAPTSGAPTMLVSGIPMHRIKDIDPIADTKLKVKTLGAVHGQALDTATGLGYTAIELAKTASKVVTVELDPSAIEIAKENPWSRELFTRENITRVIGDVFEVIKGLPSGEFSFVLHDPPTFQFAGELYSLEFYSQMHRVLSRRGKLFHYVGDPQSGIGNKMTPGVIKRLKEAGFAKVERRPEAFGVLASH